MPVIKLSDPASYESYFEEIARRHRAIRHTNASKHFYPFDAEEVESGLRGEIKFPCLVLEYNEGNFEGPNLAQLNEKIRSAFWVLLAGVDPGDFKARNDSLRLSKEYGYEILAKMKQDSENGILFGFDVRNVRYMKVGPMFPGNHYFVRWEWDATNGINNKLCFDESKWLI